MSWSDVHRELASAPPGTTLRVAKAEIGPPIGASSSNGLGAGEHWRFAPDEKCRGLHVRDDGTGSYEVHLDRVHPACSVIGHLRVDAPGVFVTAGMATGAAIGGACRGAGGAIVGGAIGLAFAAYLTR